MRDAMTRDELTDALEAHPGSPYRRSTLERMSDDELAAAANSTGVGFDDLRRAARRPESGGGIEVRGILADPPASEGGARNRRTREGDLAALRRTFSPGAASGDVRAENADLDVDVRPILSGPRGEAAVDE